ncbi:terpene cyclase/mutase family protein [Stieleria sp. TO1_6]|uniref:prenyltransferase/squalene oxidase repeat-containing protein n=1 Tax=Stieleria tagensis TaxID=2956795 RepID=UPI00209BB8BB|nr:prenyltransferase/squalene oxidase repeat-containing protein [Stieleria tagensis]MCO8125338.1 terpene cyclase/mutase family protein [Stieleria tagensis]
MKTDSLTYLPVMVWLMVLAANSNVQAQSDRVQTAMSRGLGYLDAAGERWIKKRGCVSCHQVPTLIWSHQAAHQAGYEVPLDNLVRWQTWSTNVVHFVKPEQQQQVDEVATMASNIDTMAGLLLAMPADQHSQVWRKRFADSLCSEQAVDGSWRACGQLPMQKRPENETHAVTTLWTTYALLKQNASFDCDRAVAFADTIRDAQSTEWWATRLLVARQLGHPNSESLRAELVSRQHDDGGWGFLSSDSSDALGTGYAMYALAVTAADDDRLEDDTLERAQNYLLRTQTESGRWVVPGTKRVSKGSPTATANDWGTAWALIALATATGGTGSDSSRPLGD